MNSSTGLREKPRIGVLGRVLTAALAGVLATVPGAGAPPPRLLDDHLLVTWYGNPRSCRMGVLGEQDADTRAAALKAQAAAYAPHTSKPVLPAYHLVAVVATCTSGADKDWRRRETRDVIDALLVEARAHGFHLILDVQPGHSNVADEVAALVPWLREPDVHLALDPEFDMAPGETPGKQIGQMSAADVNGAIAVLERLVADGRLPPKVLIVHQFRLDMLPDKKAIRTSATVDVVLTMDGFGSQALKRDSYRTVMRQPLAFAGIKLFYKQDTNLFSPAQVLGLTPVPSVVVYQ